MQDPYVILGIARDADAAEIRRAYRVLAARVHPDLQPPARRAWAHAEMVRLNVARAQLLDPRPARAAIALNETRMWPFALGFWLCFALSMLVPFVAFSPDASRVLVHIVATLATAALSVGVWAYLPLIASIGVALFVARSLRVRA